MNEIWQILRVDFKLEFRNPFLLYSALLFVVSSTYTAYLSHSGIIQEESWLAVLLILLIFSALFAAQQSFNQSSGKSYLLFHQLIKPSHLFLGRLIFQLLFQSVLTAFTLGFMFFLFTVKIEHPSEFILLIFLASLALTSVLTTMSGLAARAGKNQSLLTILCLPLLYPVVSLSVKAGSMAMKAPFLPEFFHQITLLLFLVFGLSTALGLLLFPYIWRD